MWSKGDLNPGTPGVSVIYDSGDPAGVDPEYKGRTELRGNLTEKQCSLLIKNIRREDEGDYYLTLKSSTPCKTEKNHYRDTPASLSIVENPGILVPGQLIAGKPAHLTCSLSQSCSTANYKLQWILEVRSLPTLPDSVTSQLIRNSLEDSWTVSSTYSFTPSLENLGEILTCQLITADGQAAGQVATPLDVQYKPTIVSDLNCTHSKNRVYCICLVRANPPANITWNFAGRNLTGNISEVAVHSWPVGGRLVQSSLTLTLPTGSENLILCVAENEHGVRVREHQHYSPDKPVSDLNCTHSKNGVYCICLVRANPPANITWNFAGRNLTGNISEVAVHSWPVGGRLVQSSLTLTLPTGSENLILCVAENEHGVSVREHQLHSPGTPLLTWNFSMLICYLICK
ncbi:myelin-associated glycoprotein-like [Scyliorhinus torazame]|uniref:myelin-associated glycoprotein-like n=1 Tax=Scyliorhinus torazame TaxID=75743 RepID=UPI003B5BADF5